MLTLCFIAKSGVVFGGEKNIYQRNGIKVVGSASPAHFGLIPAGGHRSHVPRLGTPTSVANTTIEKVAISHLMRLIDYFKLGISIHG